MLTFKPWRQLHQFHGFGYAAFLQQAEVECRGIDRDVVAVLPVFDTLDEVALGAAMFLQSRDDDSQVQSNARRPTFLLGVGAVFVRIRHAAPSAPRSNNSRTVR